MGDKSRDKALVAHKKKERNKNKSGTAPVEPVRNAGLVAIEATSFRNA